MNKTTHVTTPYHFDNHEVFLLYFDLEGSSEVQQCIFFLFSIAWMIYLFGVSNNRKVLPHIFPGSQVTRWRATSPNVLSLLPFSYIFELQIPYLGKFKISIFLFWLKLHLPRLSHYTISLHANMINSSSDQQLFSNIQWIFFIPSILNFR